MNSSFTLSRSIFKTLLGLSALGALAIVPVYGHADTKTYDINNITDVVVRNAVKVEFAQAETEHLEVIGSAKALEKVLVETKGNKLILGRKPSKSSISFSSNGDDELMFKLHLKHLDVLELRDASEGSFGDIQVKKIALELSGSSKLKATNMTVDQLQVEVSGASHLALGLLVADHVNAEVSGDSEIKLEKGTSKTLKAEVNGASHLEASDFETNSADLEVSGASGVKLHVIETLSAEASGVSSIRYSGKPVIKQSDISGASNLIPL